MLTEAEKLIHRALRAHELAQTAQFSVAEPIHGGPELVAMVRRCLAQSHDRSASIGYVAGFADDPWPNPLLSPSEEFLLEHATATRVLVGSGLRDEGPARVRKYESLVRQRAHVRVLDHQLPHFAVLNRTVLIRASGVRDYVATSDPQVVLLMGALFDALFDRAVEVSVAGEVFGGLDEDSRTVRVLALLDAGHTDEAAARLLGVSVRTYRRYVAHAMGRLGVSSRFQAGARAAALNLIPSRNGSE